MKTSSSKTITSTGGKTLKEIRNWILVFAWGTIVFVVWFWKPIVAVFVYHDLRCILADCRIQK